MELGIAVVEGVVAHDPADGIHIAHCFGDSVEKLSLGIYSRDVEFCQLIVRLFVGVFVEFELETKSGKCVLELERYSAGRRVA